MRRPNFFTGRRVFEREVPLHVEQVAAAFWTVRENRLRFPRLWHRYKAAKLGEKKEAAPAAPPQLKVCPDTIVDTTGVGKKHS